MTAPSYTSRSARALGSGHVAAAGSGARIFSSLRSNGSLALLLALVVAVLLVGESAARRKVPVPRAVDGDRSSNRLNNVFGNGGAFQPLQLTEIVDIKVPPKPVIKLPTIVPPSNTGHAGAASPFSFLNLSPPVGELPSLPPLPTLPPIPYFVVSAETSNQKN